MFQGIMSGHAVAVLRTAMFGPQISCEVPGFEAVVERKIGTSLVRPEPDGKGGTKNVPADAGYYYEVRVRPTGGHAEYPAAPRPSVYRFTVSDDPSASGVKGSLSYLPAGSRFLGFTVAEKLHRADRHTMGMRMPDHYGVGVYARYMDADGRVKTMSIGGWVRKTTLHSQAWQMAARSPVFYG